MTDRERPRREDLLAVARTLSERSPEGAVFARRAASTAYYAAFHALAGLCTEILVPETAPDSIEHLRVYRALDHGPLKTVFAQVPLKDNPAIARIGAVVVKLQSARIAADYLPLADDPIKPEEAAELVRQARQLLDDLDALAPENRRLLAVCLLFRTRDATARS